MSDRAEDHRMYLLLREWLPDDLAQRDESEFSKGMVLRWDGEEDHYPAPLELAGHVADPTGELPSLHMWHTANLPTDREIRLEVQRMLDGGELTVDGNRILAFDPGPGLRGDQ